MATAFETSTEGTSETLWQSALETLPAWMPSPGSLLVLAPHPDDETFGAGGLLYQCSEAGASITVLLITDGEKARPELPDLRERRASEFHTALSILAPRARVVSARLPDGEVANHASELSEHLHRLVTPGTLLVAPYELDGHTDHEAAARAALDVARQPEVPCVRYPIWAWHRLRPQALKQSNLLRYPLSPPALKAKQLAMNCYVSQLEDRHGGAIVPAHVLRYFQRNYEVFVA